MKVRLLHVGDTKIPFGSVLRTAEGWSGVPPKEASDAIRIDWPTTLTPCLFACASSRSADSC